MGSEVTVPIQVLLHGQGLPLPQYMTPQSAGMDLMAAVADSEVIGPGEWKLIPTGIAIALPEGFEAQVRPRSGLALRHGVTMLNSPGTIDADYRGEIGVIMINHGREPFAVNRGERVAQLVVARHERVSWVARDHLSATDRGAGGFGHTGK